MTEQEYIDATDLTKLRIADRCLRDMQPEDDGRARLNIRRALIAIAEEIQRLEGHVHTDEEE